MKFFQALRDYFKLSHKEKLSHDFTIIFSGFLVALLCFLFGEKLKFIGAYGDEWSYAQHTKELYKAIFVEGINIFRLQRVLPCVLVHFSLRLFNLPFSDANLMAGFGMYVVGLQTLVGYFWCLIATELKISAKGKWLGFVGLFFNFAVLKYYHYVPISTDCFGYAIAMGMLCAYLRNNFWGLYAAIILALFTWPTLVYVGIILSFLAVDKEEQKGSGQPIKFFLNYIAALAVVVFLGYKMIHWFTGPRAMISFRTGIFSTGTNQPMISLVKFSMGVALVYVFAALSILFNNQKFLQFRYWKTKINVWKPLLVLATVFGAKWGLAQIPVTKKAGYTFSYLLKDTLGVALMAPAEFIVAHVAYYGPVFILLIFFWRPVCKYIQEHGAGLVAVATISVILSLNSESRKMVDFYVFLLPFLIKAIDSIEWNRVFYWVFPIVSLAVSKVWLLIDEQSFGPNPLEFPNQRYFMNFGPYMSHDVYRLQGGVVVFISVVFLIFIFLQRKKSYA